MPTSGVWTARAQDGSVRRQNAERDAEAIPARTRSAPETSRDRPEAEPPNDTQLRQLAQTLRSKLIPASPSSRAALRAITQLRRRRVGPFIVPWRVLLKGKLPDPKQPPNVTDAGVFGVPILEARVANALWTSLPFDLDGIDVGVGRRTAWVATDSGALVCIDTRTGKKKGGAPAPPGILGTGSASRVSVSRELGWDSVTERPWVIALGATWVFSGGSWQLFGPQDASALGGLDIAVGVVPSLNGAFGFLNVYRANAEGVLERLHGGSSASQWFWFPLDLNFPQFDPTNSQSALPALAVALERTPPGSDAAAGALESNVWVIRDDDQVHAGSAIKPAGGVPNGAWDLGASGDVVWALGTVQAPDPLAKGNRLWRMDSATKQWEPIAPGWGKAIDVDEDGNPWVLDTDGRLHVRGARMPAIFEVERGMPKPGESWPDYFAARAAGQLYPETVSAARAVGAGGTVNIGMNWETYDSLPTVNIGGTLVDLKELYRSQLAASLANERGVALLYCFAPIFNKNRHVPPNLAVPANSPNGYLDFKNALVQPYANVLKLFATIPGFRERVRYLSLGNEVDAYFVANFGGQQEVWENYFDFCAAVAEELRPVLPYTKFGVTWTFPGMRDYPVPWSLSLKGMDCVFVNYYAGDGANNVASPSQYAQEFQELRALADAHGGGRPIVFQELGMPTDPTLGGSEAKQAAFLQFILNQWDDAGIRIRFLSWFTLHDFLYDPALKVHLATPADPTSTIEVETSTYPATWPDPLFGEQPFWGPAHDFPYTYFGPLAAGNQGGIPTNADRVYWINQSTTAGTDAARVSRFLAHCGLLQADGTPKLAWSVLQKGLEQRRRQV
jgi:hypothetical protein